jgi:hypothetical protein
MNGGRGGGGAMGAQGAIEAGGIGCEWDDGGGGVGQRHVSC